MGRTEAFAWSAGCLLLVLYAAGEAYFAVESRRAIASFLESKSLQVQRRAAAGASAFDAGNRVHDIPTLTESRPDFEIPDFEIRADATRALGAPAPDVRSWSASRIDRYNNGKAASIPGAILRIEALDLEVPVYDGTSERTLNQGAGLVEGTAPIGTGNTALAAHRDGYFRNLGDLELGDPIEIETLEARYTYLVNEIRIVTPAAIEVLAPSDRTMLTLVTCYPFYFAGPAPERFVVRAVLKQTAGPAFGSTSASAALR